MLAEDHKLVRVGMKTLLDEDETFQTVAEAATGKEAVEKAALHKPDVILMDIGLPEIDGIKADFAPPFYPYAFAGILPPKAPDVLWQTSFPLCLSGNHRHRP